MGGRKSPALFLFGYGLIDKSKVCQEPPTDAPHNVGKLCY